mmetsp:Transcript_116112/g.311246  ORF Transcript_116112/g.311246 Transcript_116112/m.311246 type:complete len:152 (-) Transcript_116112:165-620(-)
MSDTESFAVVPSEFAEGPVVPCPLVRRSNGANVPFLEYRPIHDAHLMKDGHIKKQQQWERDNRDRCIEAPHFAEAEAWAAAEELRPPPPPPGAPASAKPPPPAPPRTPPPGMAPRGVDALAERLANMELVIVELQARIEALELQLNGQQLQ